MQEKIMYIDCQDVPRNTGLSHAVIMGNLIFVSGQVGLPLGGGGRPAGLVEEINVAIDSLKKVLDASGSSLDRVLRTNCYLSDINDMELFTEIYEARFLPPRPARTTVQARLAGDLRFEIDAIAWSGRESQA